MVSDKGRSEMKFFANRSFCQNVLQKLMIIVENDPLEKGELIHREVLEPFCNVKTIPIFKIVITLDKTKHQGHSFVIFVLIIIHSHRYCQEIFEILKPLR